MNFRIDEHKLHFHPQRVAEWQVSRGTWDEAQAIYPIYVEISPVGACNHRCTFCAVDYIGYQSVMLEADVLAQCLFEMVGLGIKSVMFAGEGEPLLHKQINDICLAATIAGMDVAFTTNGVLLDRLDLTGMGWVKVSINAGTRSSYVAIHRAQEKDWDRVWSNVKDAVQRKGPCTLGVQMVLLPENLDEIYRLEQLCADAGVDYLVLKPYSQHKFSLTHQYQGFAPLEIHPRWERTIFREQTAKTREISYEKCQATPYFWAYIMASGEVYSCSAYLMDERFRLGNINTESFREIWQGERRHQNWELVSDALDIHECRVNCRMDKANRYLTDLVNGVPHQNFI